MSGNNLCKPSLRLHNGGRHLSDALLVSIRRLEQGIISSILSKLPGARREAKRRERDQEVQEWLAVARRERESDQDKFRDEDPIAFEEPAPTGEPHRLVSRDYRVWTTTSLPRQMER